MQKFQSRSDQNGFPKTEKRTSLTQDFNCVYLNLSPSASLKELIFKNLEIFKFSNQYSFFGIVKYKYTCIVATHQEFYGQHCSPEKQYRIKYEISGECSKKNLVVPKNCPGAIQTMASGQFFRQQLKINNICKWPLIIHTIYYNI